MKKDIHPTYHEDATVTCACGTTFTAGSTLADTRVEVCSACHPIYTGKMKFVDTMGRVERFQKKQEIGKKKQAVIIAKRQKQIKDREQRDNAPKTLREMLLGDN